MVFFLDQLKKSMEKIIKQRKNENKFSKSMLAFRYELSKK